MWILLPVFFCLLPSVTHGHRNRHDQRKFEEMEKEISRLRKEPHEAKHHNNGDDHGHSHGGHDHHHSNEMMIPGSSLVPIGHIDTSYTSLMDCAVPSSNYKLNLKVGKSLIVNGASQGHNDELVIGLRNKKGDFPIFIATNFLDLRSNKSKQWIYAETFVNKKYENTIIYRKSNGTHYNPREIIPITPGGLTPFIYEIKINKDNYEVYIQGKLRITFPHHYSVKDLSSVVICRYTNGNAYKPVIINSIVIR